MALILFGVFIALRCWACRSRSPSVPPPRRRCLRGFGTAKNDDRGAAHVASCDSFSLIAVPFFIFAGDLLAGGKISKVLVEFCESLLGMIKGGLSVVSVLAGMFFAAISGSGAATTAGRRRDARA